MLTSSGRHGRQEKADAAGGETPQTHTRDARRRHGHALPKRPNEPKSRDERQLPKCGKSSTENESTDPNRDKSAPDTELPKRPNEPKSRDERKLPKCRKSSTGNESTDPNRDKPTGRLSAPGLRRT